MHSPEPDGDARASSDVRRRVLALAALGVDEGLRCGRPPRVALEDQPERLAAPGACFVTLRRDGELRGCIGSLEPRRALAEDVAANAYSAAFRDPRFPPLEAAERPGLDFHVAILGPREPLTAASEADLLRQLRPGTDGLVLRDGAHRATFLPAVWDSLPDPLRFVRELKHKAGLPRDHWSPEVRLERYRVESFS